MFGDIDSRLEKILRIWVDEMFFPVKDDHAHRSEVYCALVEAAIVINRYREIL